MGRSERPTDAEYNNSILTAKLYAGMGRKIQNLNTD